MDRNDYPTSDNPEAVSESTARIRLPMLQAYAQMLHQAFDALLHYGINYRDLPEYKDDALLKDAERLTPLRGQERYLNWIERLGNSIRAAINRKGLRKL